MEADSEKYSEPCQTSKMEIFAKIVNGFSFSSNFAKSSILDVWQDSEFVSEASNNLRKKIHLSCFNHFCKTMIYFFTKFDQHIPPYIKKYSIVHGQIHMTLVQHICLMKKLIMVFPNHAFLLTIWLCRSFIERTAILVMPKIVTNSEILMRLNVLILLVFSASKYS